jgi:hypothetical protein
MIIDWTRDEEAKYQATLVAKEVDKFKTGLGEKINKEGEAQSLSRTASRSSTKSGLKSSTSAGRSKGKGKLKLFY